MATDPILKVYDLLILVDATTSMTSYLASLHTSLPKIIAISNLTHNFARIGLLAYRDYSEVYHGHDGLLEWSGWYDARRPGGAGTVSAESLKTTAGSLRASGGADFPEATKTGLAYAYSLMRESATTILLLYTDAPPHCWMVADQDRWTGSNYYAEQAALRDPSSYAGYGHHFADWISACKQLRYGPKQAHVFCFLDSSLGSRPMNSGYYTYLSTITRGACFLLKDSAPHSIAKVTMDVLLAWMGVVKTGAEGAVLPAKLIRYKNGDNILNIKDEKDAGANAYFWAHSLAPGNLARPAEEVKANKVLAANLAEVNVDSTVLKKYLPKKKTPALDFAQLYAKDETYRNGAINHLKHIIETDVTSLSLNPVIGALWRAVCNDRENPARAEVLAMFSFHVDKIADPEEKTRMKSWLEESYDYAGEIVATLKSVPAAQRFPCVFLDPTVGFSQAKKKGERACDEEDENDRVITAFRRDELLEIGRSCDGRILRRLGKVLTQITFVECAADLPAHMADTTNTHVPRIPLALGSEEHGWQFWKLLLHVVLPGTKLSARPATVLAALAIRIGLKPLFGAAVAAMLFWRDKWNNLEVPETWNSSCLGLLLDADMEYRKQINHDEKKLADNEDALLLNADRELFYRLVNYQHTGGNLLTDLTAKVGWTPDKTQMPIGPVVVCSGCNFPRSVTIMAERSGGRCGLCIVKEWISIEDKKRCITAHVTQQHNESSSTTWVECSVRMCRAQYVCYNVGDLNVSPKCHYCRMQRSKRPGKHNHDLAPTLECVKCLSKVIWPEEYRAMAENPFHCIACTSGRETVITIDTNANQLCEENGQAWLLRNDNNVIKNPFQRSLYYTILNTGTEAFLANAEVLPQLEPAPILKLRDKRIRNQDEMLAEFRSWIERRTSEQSLCSLCFNNLSKACLLPACRRRGCHQLICKDCLDGWYSLNRPGTIINTAALFCPFCRRPPAARTLAAYGRGIHAVGDVMHAVKDTGQWIYAWCYDCGKARRYMARECARGAPATIEDWKCEICIDSDLERARVAEEETRRALQQATRPEQRAAIQRQLDKATRLRNELMCPVKNCPGCKMPTQKTAGCDHMECPMPGCGEHWCWSCGEGFFEGGIYEHMHKVHGGIYSGGEGSGEVDHDLGY
jgi:hypothetical protein